MLLVPSLEESVLRLLATRERYGLEVAQGIRLVTQGQKKVGYGAIYPVMRKLEQLGMIKGRWGADDENGQAARRRYYRIAVKGTKELAQLDEMRNKLGKLKEISAEDSADNRHHTKIERSRKASTRSTKLNLA